MTPGRYGPAILLGGLDAFEAFMAAGLDEIPLPGSRQRLREVQVIWQRAQVHWPREERVKAPSDGLHQAASARELRS